MPNNFEKLLAEAQSYSGNTTYRDDETENVSETSSTVLKETCCVVADFPDIDNIIHLENKSEEHVTAFMKCRYLNKEFYTWAGQTLLAVHPYEDPHMTTKDTGEFPCVDAVVSRAWFKLSREIGKKNQAIVISGESGSGKTFSACLAMKCIAGLQENKSANPGENVLWQAWSSVPLLTAFGNASTEHNNNSSRFGKLLQLQYEDNKIVGAFIRTYMLEKCRVTGPNFQEGNFHIFRQILESVDDDTLSKFHLDRNEVYKIAPKPENAFKSTYSETVKSLNILAIDNLCEILTVLSVVLNLGNVNFCSRDDTCHVTRDSQFYLANVAKLLGVDPGVLIRTLTTKTFAARSQGNKRETVYTTVCDNKEECKNRRNCLMRFLYEKLFLWLVDRLNARIYKDGTYNLIGILDVYGFEVFDNNTFEQLCINYANERLQQYFVSDYLVKQRNELISEGFRIEEIDINDHALRINVIDGGLSIFGILNEECEMKRFNTDVFVNMRLAENLSDSPYFENPCNNFSTTFVIRHYAGKVAYDTKSMLYKNRDKVPDDMTSFLKTCKFWFLRVILQTNVTNQESPGKTLLTKFKKSLDKLMQTLNEADVHYIKCLKPNSFQINGFMDEPFFAQQMASNGVFEIFKLHFQNFYIKLRFVDFIEKFSPRLFNCLQHTFKCDIHIGKEFIYLTKNGYAAFDVLKYIENSTAARKIQICWKRHQEKRRSAAVKIQKFYRRVLSRNKCPCIENFIDLSKKSSELLIGQEMAMPRVHTNSYINSCRKAEEYLKTRHLSNSYEGEPLSLSLEKIYNYIQTKPFKRVIFSGDHIVSYNRLAEVPVRLHLTKTCIPHSNLLPKSELPKGLPDIF